MHALGRCVVANCEELPMDTSNFVAISHVGTSSHRVLERPGTGPCAARSCVPHLARMVCHPYCRPCRAGRASSWPGAEGIQRAQLVLDSYAFRPGHLVVRPEGRWS